MGLTIVALGCVRGKLPRSHTLLMGALGLVGGGVIERGEETQKVIRDCLAHSECDCGVVLGEDGDQRGGDVF